MKLKTLFFVCIISCEVLFSQQINCVDQQKEFTKLVSNYDFVNAKKLYYDLLKECPSQNEELYLIGAKVFQFYIDSATKENKETAINDLLNVYDAYDTFFPENKNGNLVNKAMVLNTTKQEASSEVFELLNIAFDKDKFQFVDPNALYIYFKMYVEKYKSKNTAITFDELLAKYIDVSTVIVKNNTELLNKKTEFANATIAINSLVKSNFTSQNLINLAESKFDKKKEDVEWLEVITNLLFESDAASPTFEKMALQLDKLNPTAKSSFYLANYNVKNKKQSIAINYFNQAITLENNAVEKAKTYYIIASITSGTDKASAKKNIQLAAENDPTNGKYYIFLGNLYANAVNECGTSTFEKKAIYKLASLTVKKAAVINPSFLPTVTQLESEYAKFYPTSKELEAIKKMGGKITIGCWINETVPF